jgi:hypothetical protein
MKSINLKNYFLFLEPNQSGGEQAFYAVHRHFGLVRSFTLLEICEY